MSTYQIKQQNVTASVMQASKCELSTRIPTSSSPFKTCGRRFSRSTKIFSPSSGGDFTTNTAMRWCDLTDRFQLIYSATCGRRTGVISSTLSSPTVKRPTSQEKWSNKATRPRKFFRWPRNFSLHSVSRLWHLSSGETQLFKSPMMSIHSALHQLGTFVT